MTNVGRSCILLTFLLCLTSARSSDDPLHVRIDRLILAKAGGAVGPVSSDSEFLRRVYLDLAGRIPSLAETRSFLGASALHKRATLIDQLMASEMYPRRMRDLFHVMLNERRGDDPAWSSFLLAAFQQNKPWDEMAREMVNPDADDQATRGAAFFITKRLEKYGQNPTDYPGLVRDVGRMFLGVDVQCAQCHDHLFVDDYKQVYYQGLYAFLGTAFIRRDVSFPAVGENLLAKKIDFTSVFEMKPMATGPRVLAGKEIAIPAFEKGDEYIVAPDRKKRSPGKLKFSPLATLADQLPMAENDAFARNIANRLWWVMMGRGLVEPLDMQHNDNPPSHPQLLKLLADQLTEHQFDIKWLIRELARTDVYQRSSRILPGSEPPPPESYRVAIERPLLAEQLLDSMLLATGAGDIRKASNADSEGDEQSKLREHFKAALANPPREPEIDFNPSVKAALFLSNDETVLSWLEPRDGNLVDRLSKSTDKQQLAEELYLAILTRLPDEDEANQVAQYVTRNKQRPAIALRNLAWALIASTEFCINH